MASKGQVGPAGAVLPEPLASRYPGGAEEVGHGGEADVFRVHGTDGKSFAVKLYRHGIRADRHIWDRLERLRHAAVVRVEDRGTADDGRDYEVLEYLAGGSLLDRLGTPMTERQTVAMARQLAGGLNCLHEAGVVHRDLKPANLLYRGTEAESGLVIADFGISRDPSTVMRTNSATVAYAPPEALLRGTVSSAHDWWSLGMIVRQAATGATPFAGRSESEIMATLETGNVALDQVPGERLQRLCAGLLHKDPALRWAGKQVLEWLDGKDVPVRLAKPDTVRVPAAATVVKGGGSGADRPAQVPGFEYAGERHTTRSSLAAAIRKDRQAARRLFGDMGTREAPSERWRGLLEWIRGIDGLGIREREQRTTLIDEWLHRDYSADVKLLRLLLWLDPAGAPVLRGDAIGPDRLAGMCAAAYRKGADAQRRLVTMLEGEVVRALGEFPALRHLQQNWRASVRGWRRAVETTPGVPGAVSIAARSPDPSLNLLLLLCSLPGEVSAKELGALGGSHPSPEGDDTWFGELYRACRSADPSVRYEEAVRIHCGAEFEREQAEKRSAALLLESEQRESRALQDRTERYDSRMKTLAAEDLRLKEAWDATERHRLRGAARLSFAALAGLCHLVCVAVVFVVPCELVWGTSDVTAGTDRALLYETAVLALPGFWAAMKRGWQGGSAYRPAPFTLLHGKAGAASWWADDTPGTIWWGTMWSAAYVWIVGYQWDTYLGHRLHHANSFYTLLDVALLAVTGLVALITAAVFTALEKKVPLGGPFLQAKREYERGLAEVEAARVELRAERHSQDLLAALRSPEGLARLGHRFSPGR
ncbi:serine/threonine-protein kinase [Streptomyces sp. NPDC059618]|uniref:serine/threonine-protein kinase n=1 Tax=Streptomyces sp. NPDC059618 TaxID=3346887 RepID=UPI0036972F3D